MTGLLALVLALSLPAAEVQAQCPMCRMSAESNLKNGGTTGRGLNTRHFIHADHALPPCWLYRLYLVAQPE